MIGNEQESWARETDEDFHKVVAARRYGGDLQGVLNKLDYLQDLGITAIYFNPLNDAPSLHKYDARNYRHIRPEILGQTQLEIIQSSTKKIRLTLKLGLGLLLIACF